jgi:hypothetical protein
MLQIDLSNRKVHSAIVSPKATLLSEARVNASVEERRRGNFWKGEDDRSRDRGSLLMFSFS